jgi:hypothetical protein
VITFNEAAVSRFFVLSEAESHVPSTISAIFCTPELALGTHLPVSLEPKRAATVQPMFILQPTRGSREQG